MPSRQSTVPTLDLNLPTSSFNNGSKNPASQSADGLKAESLSPLTPRSPKSSPSSPFANGYTIRPVTRRSKTESALIIPSSPNGRDEPPTPGLTSLPQYPVSPKDSPKHNRDASKSFFANLKASKSSHKLSTSDSSGQSGGNLPKSRSSSRDRSQLTSKANRSTPDLLESSGRSGNDKGATGEDTADDRNGPPHNDAKTSEQSHVKKSKPRFANLLTRTRSIRVDDNSGSRRRRPSNAALHKVSENGEQDDQESKTAPSRSDKASKDAPGSTVRNRSADRPMHSHPVSRKERSHGASLVTSASLSQVSGASAALFNNLKQSSSEAADRLGKAGKGFLGKITRSGSTNEREMVTDDNYVCKVINLPLIEQTRKTRISKRLEDCKDKTEYWMPALPYRCIDYLNFKGCEEEGLYRVPGSGKEVKHWQRRFDMELDINLFDEPDLYDINTIGSMFKAWLRELPDELFPKETQAMIAEKCEGATTAPQMLRDELSKLPPYNYYLLFAITCHLNLLHSYVEQNKMDYRNLCICFQPCMKIDGFCFQFLVCDWKNCWQGCWTEKEWLKLEKEAEMAEREKAAREGKTEGKTEQAGKGNENSHSGPSNPLHDSAADERAISSSGSSQPSQSEETSKETSKSEENSKGRRPPKLENTHSLGLSQLPELGPPLSPIKI
ncbi:hypothetical protein VTN77DRAFT_3606 [Rasamsonia byssochlamydoides]|uniref:uncharacterized protein n=1 Tax=Rasamsonia byssochlamydoides TaxID=89139 RepID=UPI003742F3B7